MPDYQVEFLEVPTVGSRVHFTSSGQRYQSSPLAFVHEHPLQPGLFLARTQSGSLYTGRVRAHAKVPSSGVIPPAPLFVKPAGLSWAGTGQTLRIGIHTLFEPLVYWSNDPLGNDEPSCINLRLPVDWTSRQSLEDVGYYPSYEGLTPSQRGYYIRWLVSGRKSPLYDIGYAFIFFYGLERRSLAEGQDLSLIAAEVVRLLNTYTNSRSFTAYLGRFLRHIIGTIGVKALTPPWYVSIFRDTLTSYDEDILAVALAWLYEMGAPLPSWLAYQVAKLDPRSQDSVVLKRIPEEFKELFRRRYRHRFGKGMMLQAAERPRALHYYRANGSLHGRRLSAPDSILLPHVTGLPSQFAPLVQIWSECVSELKAYSRQAAGSGSRPQTRQAFRLLPPEFQARTEHPDADKWQQAVAGRLGADGVAIVRVGEIAPMVDCSKRDKLTLTQSIDLAQTACDVGYSLLPDCRESRRAYRWDQRAVLTRMPSGTGSDSAMLKAALTMLELGMSVAAADGQLLEEELRHLDALLQSQFHLSTEEGRKLHALRVLLEQDPPSVSGLLRGLKDRLPPDQRKSIAEYLVAIASIDGYVTHHEVAALVKVYSALDLSPNALQELLAGLSIPIDETVEVLKDDGLGQDGEALPDRAARVIELDMSRLAVIQQQTYEVAQMLHAALVDSESGITQGPPANAPMNPADAATEAAAPDKCQSKVACSPALGELEPRYWPLLETLLTRAEWPPAEFADKARDNGLMPASAVEVINAWADEQLGDYLIEEGETYFIRLSLMEKGIE